MYEVNDNDVMRVLIFLLMYSDHIGGMHLPNHGLEDWFELGRVGSNSPDFLWFSYLC